MNATLLSTGPTTLPRNPYLSASSHQGAQRMSNHYSDANALPPIEQLQAQYPPHYYAAHQSESLPHTPVNGHHSINTPSSTSSSAPPVQTAYPPPHLQSSVQYRPVGLSLPHLPPVQYADAHSLPPSSSGMHAPTAFYSSNNASNDRLNDHRPRLGASYDPYGQPHLIHSSGTSMKQEQEPTHVVGQQGRRGILPSAPGKAPPGSVKAVVPEKNEDGKFSCPHCSKTYLHAKHLKRHMLRHTGERPYTCKLCKDTFSRSDILKRHFIKCSIRRGVAPDGDHLEGARVHNNRNRLSTGNPADPTFASGNGASQYDGAHPPGGQLVPGIPGFLPGSGAGGSDSNAYNDGMTSLSTRSSRSSSLIQPANPLSENRRSASSLELLASSRTSFDGGADFASLSSLSGAVNGIPAYAMPPMHSAGGVASHQYPYPVNHSAPEMLSGHHSTMGENSANGIYGRVHHNAPNQPGPGMAWGYPASGPEYQMLPNVVVGSSRELKPGAGLLGSGLSSADETPGDGVFSGLYSNSFTPIANQMFDGWDTGDPLEQKAAALLSFCFPNSSGYPSEEETQLGLLLSVENIKLFVNLYGNFHGHWPVIHMPTFNPATAWDGLLLAIVCVGAIYSDKLGLHQQRLLMEQVKRAVERSSRIYRIASQEAEAEIVDTYGDTVALEEIQALVLLQTMFSWHGNNQQRARARDEFWKLTVIARRLNLLTPIPPNHPQSSVLHCSNAPLAESDYVQWQWHLWVEQEKRSRAMYLIWLVDTAMVLFFNSKPQFDSAEVRLQLPADDAAWEARTPEDCMAALGLRGPDEQQACNSAGSKRARQPEFRAALRLLHDPKNTFQHNSTNIYSKFILIHALHVHIWNAQRQASNLHSPVASLLSKVRSGANTPLSANDWVNHDPAQSQPSSGRATPDANHQAASHAHLLQQLTNAVEKWKSIWDIDIEIQYPQLLTPGGTPLSRRKGFCRDAIHFYWLARKFLASTKPLEWQLPADHRFHFVMQNLKAIKNWVASEAYKQGKDIGSVVDIGEEYGIQDLTLDMKLLFAPLALDDAVIDQQLL